MRGGRFQQKTSEGANSRNAEVLFETRTIVEIREVEARTRSEIEEKKEELRQLVGASYRDLIESADSILLMRKSCEAVSENIQKMEEGFNSLKKSMTGTNASPNSDRDRKRREKLYGIGSRVKYLVDTPEKIWGCLDEHMYFEGAERYLRAREVHSLLTETTQKEEKTELLANFPLLRHQWPLVETFRGQISQRSRDRLQETGLSVGNYAVALAGVAIIDDLHSSQIFNLFLETRKMWLRVQIRAAISGRERVIRDKGVARLGDRREIKEGEVTGAEVGNKVVKIRGSLEGEEGGTKDEEMGAGMDADTVAAVLCKLVQTIQCSLCHVGELLLEVSGKTPLLYSTVLTAPPGSQLFGGIPNPEKEVRLWKAHREKLETSMVPLSAKHITESCISWLKTCAKEIAVEGKLLLQQINSGAELAKVEKIIREDSAKQTALGDSLDWLKSAFGKSVESPWDSICELLLKEPTNLWDTLFENIFVSRMKEVIGIGFRVITIKDLLNDTLSVGSSFDFSAQESWVGKLRDLDTFRTLENPGSRGVLREGSGSVWTHLVEDRESSSPLAFFNPEVARVKDRVDEGLKTVLEDLVSFLQGPQIHSRTEELAPFLQEECRAFMLSIIQDLDTRLSDISGKMNILSGGLKGEGLKHLLDSLTKNSVGDESPALCSSIDPLAPEDFVEKALFLGRLSAVLGQHSSSLPIILGNPAQWIGQKKPIASNSSVLTVGRNNWLERDQFLVQNPEKWVLKRGKTGAAGVNEKFPKLVELQERLRHQSIAAHRIWVVSSAERLAISFLNDLQKDDCLCTLTPLKGWEETVLKQEEENGGEVELRMALPAMPSPYAVTFLYAGCLEIYRVGGHVLDKAILRYFSWILCGKVLSVYESFISNASVMKDRVSEKGLLQLLFDLRFLADVLSGGQDVDNLDLAGTTQESFTSVNNKWKQATYQSDVSTEGQKRRINVLLSTLCSKLDPIDWAIYEPHLWDNERSYYQRCAILFGLLIQLNRLYTNTVLRLSSRADTNTLNMSGTVPRFTYLPISAPIFSVSGGSALRPPRGLSGNNVTGEWNPYSNGSDGYKFASSDNSNMYPVRGYISRPTVKSFMDQVGSKFGEGLKLGLLSDGQVERFKDKSAAAISTFGDMLPVQAAGLFSSLTAGATKTEA